MLVGFCIRTPSVPRASIIWLAHAVKVVRPAALRLHLDRVRFAKGWHLGNTLGVCMSGFENFAFGCQRYVTGNSSGKIPCFSSKPTTGFSARGFIK
jgi:hypothetical protein